MNIRTTRPTHPITMHRATLGGASSATLHMAHYICMGFAHANYFRKVGVPTAISRLHNLINKPNACSKHMVHGICMGFAHANYFRKVGGVQTAISSLHNI